MTTGTIGFGIIFWVDEGLVDVLMTIAAAASQVLEIPPVILLMTCKTGYGKMGTLQFENALVMLFYRKG